MPNVRSATKQAFYRRWTGTLVITAVRDRARLAPISPSFERRLAQQRLAEATAADEPDAQHRLAAAQ